MLKDLNYILNYNNLGYFTTKFIGYVYKFSVHTFSYSGHPLNTVSLEWVTNIKTWHCCSYNNQWILNNNFLKLLTQIVV